MYLLLYKIYFIKFGNRKTDAFYSRLVVRIMNIMLPVILLLNPFKSKLNTRSANNRPLLIVSLTTIPVRIDKIWMVIETLLRQRTKPDRILLWLYKGEFNGRQSLPEKLRRLEKRGLEIRFCDENLMPHKKYFYTMTGYPGADVITVDDDVFYPVDLITNLIEYRNRYPDSIITTVGRKVKISDNRIYPYLEWEHVKYDSVPSFQTLPIGAGGVLIPSGTLHPDCFNIGHLKTQAPMNSDLWLKMMSIRAGTRVVCIQVEYKRLFIPAYYKNDKMLMESNVGEGRNDIVCRRLLDYYKIPVAGLID